MSPRISAGSENETYKSILSVSERLFADKGFDATGIDEIAREVGITKSVIYYHFKNKSEIRKVLINRFIQETMGLKKMSAEHQVRESNIDANHFIPIMIQFLKKRERIIRIMMAQTMTAESANPLFNFWDKNVDIAKDYRQKLFDESRDTHTKDNFLEVYFFTLIPIFSYFAFADSWCRHYDMERKDTDGIFSDGLLAFYNEYLTPRYFPSGWGKSETTDDSD
ncbi:MULTISPECIES: TetR/AcrR family transcriptional regulator [unclassified Oceanispirochaeta]|uniref:TetR/AcrR family transcriptional regulator n=1 Tax=unclassified Oceanispirochaeta TaxID=2635722 RepID=UPI000E09ABDF|nr:MULTISPECIES: TetR/AcrR family transcriptional regulator [unclassified Oceanispirochaeta]MBF9018832.1 TetR/AcrR family transcriptional regulator [Oceanispirochaeta sp. M2]NPD75301.1 TetR/AcrR family transcriptional regulator [Oceanispirochaeta sp. M1]RDG28858.1 TetR/AcrR family transcriptional regulator [Oceanispirochaeta sp. M1]